MGGAGQKGAESEIERLREALDAETRRAAEAERRLERAQAEFEEFVSRAAHDLRESLREVASFSQLTAETCHGRLDADGRKFLERIWKGAEDMQSLLAGMVDYWAAAADGREPPRTEMETVLCQALLSMEKEIAERSAVVTHDPLPAVMGDFEILAKVLRHLIGNAIEYCETPPPRVHVSAKRVDDDWIFSVADNGPGIEAAFHARLFEVFRPLHGKEHPGHGLGLAFSRKAIEGQGGRMWMESALGVGSTFYFTLPAPA